MSCKTRIATPAMNLRQIDINERLTLRVPAETLDVL
jgi:hypothetical protein